MSTPVRQPIGAPLQNLGPSSSFLQQLLEEVNGTGGPTVLRDRPISAGTPLSKPSSTASRQASSVWVGGGAIAQEAREKLRAADETRLRKSSIGGNGGKAKGMRPTLSLHTSCLDPPSSASGKSTPSSSPLESSFPGQAGSEQNLEALSSAPSSSEFRDETKTSCLANSIDHTAHFPALDDFAGTDSPHIFCDADPDVSSTPSPTEAPTSAASTTFTNATSMSEDRHGPTTDYRSSSDVAPVRKSGKRALDLPGSPEMLSKKLRTVTLPEHPSCTMGQLESRTSSWRRSIGGDNTSLLLSSSFTERTPAPVGHPNLLGADLYPDLSSFRPQAADSQGMVPRPVTPKRNQARRVPVNECNDYQEAAETPIYARSMHLFDGEDSIYRKDHGDEWRENALCLYCFQWHGNFSKLSKHGYETCGRDDPLESHY
ncbi:hypothetical protein BDU57DRAFT_542759 [Ampelomyces quisqualis]|uniref:Uncharacterized protein n=1 Tax=Ampelomyces quisqualis TaxID=50730 RepID=A0A6A5QCG7_AMPQU|nr:hypothetical protein BDU57DRAFT_542759 [Ampelomyces quisqualis]